MEQRYKYGGHFNFERTCVAVDGGDNCGTCFDVNLLDKSMNAINKNTVFFFWLLLLCLI
jgi:hypothetical protein